MYCTCTVHEAIINVCLSIIRHKIPWFSMRDETNLQRFTCKQPGKYKQVHFNKFEAPQNRDKPQTILSIRANFTKYMCVHDTCIGLLPTTKRQEVFYIKIMD